MRYCALYGAFHVTEQSRRNRGIGGHPGSTEHLLAQRLGLAERTFKTPALEHDCSLFLFGFRLQEVLIRINLFLIFCFLFPTCFRVSDIYWLSLLTRNAEFEHRNEVMHSRFTNYRCHGNHTPVREWEGQRRQL